MDFQNAEFYKLNKNNPDLIFNYATGTVTYRKEATPKGKLRIVEYRKDYDKKETTRRIVPSYEFSVEDFDIWKQKLMDEALEQRRHDDRTTRNNVNIDNFLETDLVATESVADEMIREEDERQAYERQMKELNEILSCLTEVQRRRYIQHIAYGKTTREIADEEGCSFQMVAKSIAQAEERIKKAKANRNNN